MRKISLQEVNELLSETSRILNELAIGQTIETDILRIHRYANSIRVTDLTNAGKRGKSVDEFALYDLDHEGRMDKRIQGFIEKFAKDLPRMKSYSMALKVAQGIVDEAERLAKASEQFQTVPKIETSKYQGVKVAPAGFKSIDIDGKHVRLHADNSSFHVTDKDDKYNEQTLIAPIKRKSTAIKAFLAWAKENESKIANMTFAQINDVLHKADIETHYYCAID